MGRGAPLLFRALIQLWIASLPVSASDSSPKIPSDAIDRFVRDEMGRGAIPGMALAVTRYGQVAYLRGYGAAHKSEPVMPQTQFLLASLSKSFTAIAVLQQVERGRVALDAPVQRYLPDFHISDVAASSRITVRELLNQTSGLSDAGFPEGILPQPTSIRERVESLRTARLVAPPGAEFHYFNPNYAVLARLVEVIAGQGFDDYMREHVFAPLGMANTFHADTSQALFAHAVNVAQGHLMIFGFAVPCPEMSGYLGGSAGVASTAADMARYLIFQSGNGNAGSQKMLSRESIDLMHTPPRGLAGGYAMGWVATQEHGVRAIEHNGILSAYYAEMIILPDRGIGIALLYNVESVPSMMFAFGRI